MTKKTLTQILGEDSLFDPETKKRPMTREQEIVEKLKEQERAAILLAQDTSFQDLIADELGVNKRCDLQPHQERINNAKQLKKMADLLFGMGNLKPSIHKTFNYLLKFSIDHQIDRIRISNSAIAKYTDQSRKPVIQAIRWLSEHKWIKLGKYKGTKGKPQIITISKFDESTNSLIDLTQNEQE